MADTGMDAFLVDLIEWDEIIYAGYSAGACVLAPDLRGLEEVEDITAVADPMYRGLAVLDRPLVPHLLSQSSRTGCLPHPQRPHDELRHQTLGTSRW